MQTSRCTPRWCSVHWTRIASITHESSKSHGKPDCQDAQDKQRTPNLFCPSQKEDALKFLNIHVKECPNIWIRPPQHKWPKSPSTQEGPVLPIGRNLNGDPLARLFRKRQFDKFLSQHGWEKFCNWECSFVHRGKTIVLICASG